MVLITLPHILILIILCKKIANMPLHTDNNRISKSDTKLIKSLSCFLFKQSYPQIVCNQHSQCDEVENQYGLADKAQTFKLQHNPPKRLSCNRLKSGLSELPPISESNVIQPITLPKISKLLQITSNIIIWQ